MSLPYRSCTAGNLMNLHVIFQLPPLLGFRVRLDHLRAYNRVLRGFANFSLHGWPPDIFTLLGGSLRSLWLPLGDGRRAGDDRDFVDSIRHLDKVHMGLCFQVKSMLLPPAGIGLVELCLTRSALLLET